MFTHKHWTSKNGTHGDDDDDDDEKEMEREKKRDIPKNETPWHILDEFYAFPFRQIVHQSNRVKGEEARGNRWKTHLPPIIKTMAISLFDIYLNWRFQPKEAQAQKLKHNISLSGFGDRFAIFAVQIKNDSKWERPVAMHILTR